MRRMFALLVAALAICQAAPAATAVASGRAAQPPAGSAFAYFPETGHNVGLAIKRFYDAHGGLDIFGLPLTEVFYEDGVGVQYFERIQGSCTRR